MSFARKYKIILFVAVRKEMNNSDVKSAIPHWGYEMVGP